MGVDCYGVVTLAAAHAGLMLPILPPYHELPCKDLALEAIESWSYPVEDPEPGDVAVWVVSGFPRHLGIVTELGHSITVVRESSVRERPIRTTEAMPLWGYRGIV